MTISSSAELGDTIRDRRKARGLSQDELAKLVPTSQKWVSEVENGKTTAEIGQVMRLLSVLGFPLDLLPVDSTGKDAIQRPAVRFRRTTLRTNNQNLAEQSATLRDAFKRWGLE